MFLNEPQPTPYDLRFRIGNVPVTVNPWFWLISLLFAGVGRGVTGVNILIGIAVVFVSILVHEFGHAIAMMRFGERVRIVLYGMGGLAIPDSFGAWDGARRRSGRTYIEQIIISFAGPLAGFILAGIVIVVVSALGCQVRFSFNRESQYLLDWDVYPPVGQQFSETAYRLINSLLFVNILWGLVNLLPVYPLDGGQISRALFSMFDYRNGLVNSLWLSLITGGVMAIVGLKGGDLWVAYLFGMLAYGSWQALQQFRGGSSWR